VAHLIRCIALSGCQLLLSGLVHAASPVYRVQVLPAPENCEAYSQWHGLGQRGEAVGVLSCDGGPASKAVMWDDAGLTELPTLGGPSAMPFGIGSSGLVVGMAETSEMYDADYNVQRPVLWDTATIRELGTLGGPLGVATAMSDSGVVVGASQGANDDPSLGRKPLRACVWDGESILDIGDLGGLESVAYDVNDRGWIVGWSTTGAPLGPWFEEHAFVYDGGSMLDLGTLGGSTSLAWAINAAGDVVGYSYTAPGTPSRHAFLWRKGSLIDLGTLGGPFSEALDINDRGDIVGWSRRADFVDHAVLWREGRVLDLNDLAAGAAGCVVTRATAIANRGDILADVRCGGRSRVALLTPMRHVDSGE